MSRPSSGRPARGSRATDDSDAEGPSDAGFGSRSRGRRAPATNHDTRVGNMDDIEPPPQADDADATHAGPPISVEVVEGPDEGIKKRVRGGRMVIGRGDGCDLKLKDTAASRRHLELIVGFSGAMVRDLGSGNGTKVNGERVDEAAVAHGDEIMLGTTILKVVDEIALIEERRRPKQPEPPSEDEPAASDEDHGVEPPPHVEPADPAEHPSTAQVDVPETRKKPTVLVFAAVGGVACIFIVLLAMLLRAKPTPPPAPANVTRPADAAALEAQVKSAITAGDYDKALELCDELEKADPKNADLPDLRGHTQKEKDGKAKLAAAQAAVAANDFETARSDLKSIDEAAKARDEGDALAKTLDAKESAFIVGQAHDKITAGDLDGARALLPRLTQLDPAQVDPLNKQLAQAQADKDKEAAAQVAKERHHKLSVAEARKEKAEAAVRAQLDSGYRKFRDAVTPSQYERASNEFQRIAETTTNNDASTRARKLQGKVKDFARALSEADGYENNQAYEAEVAPLDRAVGMLSDIDPQSPVMTRLRARLAKGLLLKGHNAAARQDYALAAKSYNRLLTLRPGDAQAKEGLQSLRGRAHDVYLQAYEEEARDPDTARKLYGTVMQMVGPSDEDYQKAKKRLDNLNH